MRTALVLFTRDLRVHDHPALVAACRNAARVVPLFVLDDEVLGGRYAAPNRVAALLEALEDLRTSLRARGGDLVIRWGDPIEEVRSLVTETDASEVHLSADVSGYAHRRQAALEQLGEDLSVEVTAHPGVVLVEPGEVSPTAGDHFRVFAPYWRRWIDHPHRDPLPAPERVPTPSSVHSGTIPARRELVDGDEAPDRLRTGETAARDRLDWWFDGAIGEYDRAHHDLASDATSKLSHHLHFGCLSVAEVVSRIDRRRPGHDAFLRQLCWREFNHQLLAANPDLPRQDLRSQGDDWRQDDDTLVAWREGRTGYPVVDAGMRQLRQEGWMHNRARMLTASFLTKHLRVDWRVGAWHFMDHLVDGDLANNFAQWQWVAGTGTDSRPNRMFNPVTQGRRYDPSGAYVRRYVPELANVDDVIVHAPWEAADQLFGEVDYPPPTVDHAEARERFLAARGR
ncbi:cryptochrome/photolyase family protein [Nitriliruptor alkaliphilus]|uniref:cryptochrome/photolyase family protein n=1 Tax=Nitriliruptor alkaliphilus TaxID=427918 RepID=UPI000698B0DD|nr:deoxyribodipyrimidine photo-lyase [Nitriliruptor alkaliphilus]